MPYENQLLKYVVDGGQELYRETFLVYNVPSLLHFAKDGQNFGSLDNCSDFKLDCYLHQMKKMVHSGKHVYHKLQIVWRKHQNKGKVENI